MCHLQECKHETYTGSASAFHLNSMKFSHSNVAITASLHSAYLEVL